MLRWRLLLGALIIAVLVGLAWCDAVSPMPGLWLLPVAVFFTLFGTLETLGLARAGGMKPLVWPPLLINIFVVLGPWFAWAFEGEMRNSLTFPIAILGMGLLLILVLEIFRYQKPNGTLGNIAAAVFPLVYVGVTLALAVQIRMRFGPAAIVVWIISVKMGDTGAYAVGRLIGRHKLTPVLSPGKTIEGAVGALLFACLGAWFVLGSNWLGLLARPVQWTGWLPLGLLMGVFGMVGDLAESLLKRDVGCKDSSTWLPGFGGVLDIIDSLLLTAPVAWFCFYAGLLGR